MDWKHMDIYEVDLKPTQPAAWSSELNPEIEFLQVTCINSQTHEGEINTSYFKSLNFGVVFHAALLEQ